MVSRISEAEKAVLDCVNLVARAAHDGGREAERRDIVAYLMWAYGVVESISEQDGIMRLRDAIENREHVRKGVES